MRLLFLFLNFGLGLNLIFLPLALAQEFNEIPVFSKPEIRQRQMRLDFMTSDTPFNLDFEQYKWPSMKQAVLVSKAYYDVGHEFMWQLVDYNPNKAIWAEFAFDLMSSWSPLSSTWLHEEYHRAIMSRRNISSYNNVYNFPIFADVVSVSRVKDEDLTRLKERHPAEQVRLSAAGMEAQTDLNIAIEKSAFFEDHRNHQLLLLMNTLNNILYMQSCTNSDDRIKELTAEESKVSERDFTGFDCLAWVYDLHRPEEPYASRGIHPSGTGIDRYILFSRMSGTEQRFMKRQVWLSLLNLFDPFLYGNAGTTLDSEMLGEPVKVASALRYYMTSFGYSVQWQFFSRQAFSQRNRIFTLHSNFNRKRYFPGISYEWFHEPRRLRFYSSGKMALWLQPKDQDFYAHSGAWGALASWRISYLTSANWAPYLEVEAKSQGWVAGNAYLDKNLSIRTGFSYWAF